MPYLHLLCFFFTSTSTTEIYTLSLHDALPIFVLTGAGTSAFIGECLAPALARKLARVEAIPTTDIVASPDTFLSSRCPTLDRKSTRLNSSHRCISYAVFCLKKKKKRNKTTPHH